MEDAGNGKATQGNKGEEVHSDEGKSHLFAVNT